MRSYITAHITLTTYLWAWYFHPYNFYKFYKDFLISRVPELWNLALCNSFRKSIKLRRYLLLPNCPSTESSKDPKKITNTSPLWAVILVIRLRPFITRSCWLLTQLGKVIVWSTRSFGYAPLDKVNFPRLATLPCIHTTPYRHNLW